MPRFLRTGPKTTFRFSRRNARTVAKHGPVKRQVIFRSILSSVFGLLFVVGISGTLSAADFFVAPSGNDSNPGTVDKPFASLERARDAVRALKAEKGLPAAGVTVWLAGGEYPVDKVLELGSQDSGTADAPIVYRAQEGAVVRLTGGRQIEASAFQTVSDPAVLKRLEEVAQKQVRQADLKSLGIGAFKPLPARFKDLSGQPELLLDGQPMKIARWPNEGWATIEKVLDNGLEALDLSSGERAKGVRGGTFVYKEDRPGRWDTAKGVWLHGYWCHDWADEYLQVDAIDAAKKEIKLAAPHSYGIGPSSKWNKVPRRYCALNLLEELDAPGEWYLDRENLVLYFWPPKPLEKNRVVLTIYAAPMIVAKNASYLTFRDLILEDSCGRGIVISGGTGNRVAGCTLRNLGDCGVAISGATQSGVVGCDLYNLGKSGIRLYGGDRKTLTPAQLYAVNNHVHHFGLRRRTGAPGISMGGVGNHLAHNLLHDGPNCAIGYTGNEHLIELNEIHSVALETSDVGAMYTGRDWTSRGNLVKWNYIHDLNTLPGCGSMSVYLDDCDSGDTLFGNVFYKAKYGAFIGGGRDNVVQNNIMIDCYAAVHIDARGLKRCKPGSGVKDGWDLLEKSQRLNFQQPPWSTRYPKLARVMEEEPLLPMGTVIERNVAIECKKWMNVGDQANQVPSKFKFSDDRYRKYIDTSAEAKPPVERITVVDNLVLGDDEDPGFVDAAAGDFQLKPDSVVFKKIPGFEAIPFEKIGLVSDEYRK